MELHPSSFVETGSCDGPRYIRSQPSRETGGVLLNEVTDKYVAEFNIPYENVQRYIKEIENSWEKLNPEQKSLVGKSFKSFNLPTPDSNSSSKEKKIENFGATALSILDCMGYLADDPAVRVTELLDQIYNPDQATLDEIETIVGAPSLDTTVDGLKDAMKEWSWDNSYYYGGWWVWLFFFFIILIVLFSGIGAGYNANGK